MANYVEFKGLKHYPLSNAQLEIVNNELVVSNIGNSGFDGVLIEVPEGSDWAVDLDPVNIIDDKTLNICYRGIDSLGRLKTFGELVYALNPDNGQPSTALNSWLLSDQIHVKAMKNGSVVYNEHLNVPDESNWIWFAVAAAVWAYKGDGHVKFETGDDGTNFEAEITFGQSSNSSGGGGSEPNPVTLFTGEEIDADSFSVKSIFPYQNGTPISHLPKISNILITGKNLNSLTFKDESYEG